MRLRLRWAGLPLRRRRRLCLAAGAGRQREACSSRSLSLMYVCAYLAPRLQWQARAAYVVGGAPARCSGPLVQKRALLHVPALPPRAQPYACTAHHRHRREWVGGGVGWGGGSGGVHTVAMPASTTRLGVRHETSTGCLEGLNCSGRSATGIAVC